MWVGDVMFAVFGALAYLMFKDSPPRLPKLAVIFAVISGVGFVAGVVSGWIASGLSWLIGFLPTWLSGWLLPVVLVVVAYKVINHLFPRIGKIQGGKVNPAIGVMAFFLAFLASQVAGQVPDLLQDGTGQLSDAAINFTEEWF